MVPSFPTDGPFDCQACGACCVEAGPVTVAVSDVQVPRWRTRSVRRMIGFASYEADDGVRCMKAAANGRCDALKGTTGVSVSCAIYAKRPAVCADFAPGTDLCREARARARSRLSHAEADYSLVSRPLPSADLPLPPILSTGTDPMTRTLLE